MAIKILQQNMFIILSTLFGALAAGWIGAIMMGFVGLVLDNTVNPNRR